MSENEPVKKDLQLLHSPDFYSFLILLLILELFSIYMLLFSDSYNETVFWLCVLFISLTYSLLTTIFFVVHVSIQLHTFFIYIQYSPKAGTDSARFYMDFGPNSKRFGFTNRQIHTGTTFQVFRKSS